ncbi:MAG: urea ABC transporter ATP-binding subunit UrtE [Spirochaetales bacterium]|nr:urea ABC transporter ATP-binding subunit UrtE [Spirochaetales bacterium]
MSLLSVDNIFVYYQDALILNDVSLEIQSGEVVCLLGRNGVGKTTLLRSIIGLTPPRNGSISLDGIRISGRPPYSIVKRGIGYVPQGREIFPELTVEENLKTGAFINPGWKPEINGAVFEYFPFLKTRLKEKGGRLSGGQQQMLAIARAMSGGPQLMILDEPTEGIQPSIIQEIFDIVRDLNMKTGLTILLVEQNIDFALKLSSRGYILEKGQIVSKGKVDELKEDFIVKNYLMI